jgi:predicted  nucleic acid-binding Zn-ribbon protein
LNAPEVITAVCGVAAIVISILGTSYGIAYKLGQVRSEITGLRIDLNQHKADTATIKADVKSTSTDVINIRERMAVLESHMGPQHGGT